MKNSDAPASPIFNADGFLSDARMIFNDEGIVLTSGLTKKEHACLLFGIPETGDPDLDALIVKAERKRIAAMAMRGYCANSTDGFLARSTDKELATMSVTAADTLLAELEK